jgi:hypothetical protein
MLGIIFGAGVFLLTKAFRIGVLKRIDLAKDWRGTPINNPERYASVLALVNLFGGIAFLAMVAAILVFKIPLNQWGPLTGIVAYSYVLCLNIVASRANKNSPSQTKVTPP